MQPRELIALLRSPTAAHRIAAEHWNQILVQGRQGLLLGQLAALLQRSGQLEQLLPPVRRLLELELLVAKRRGESAVWELGVMRRAIEPGVPVVVLKGCAYLVANDLNSAGRSFSDVDLLVEKTHLPQVELALVAAGWKPGAVDAYDARYYREWMHEIPPMAHVRRHTVIDLHHAINPPISRFYVDPAALLAGLVPTEAGVQVLAPLDRVVHCALHLIQEGETPKLLRDLFDLHLLVAQHCGDRTGWAALAARSQVLGVLGQVGAAVGAAQHIFAPESQLELRGHLPTSWLEPVLVAASRQPLGMGGVSGQIAAWLLLAHSHWIKMPVHILLPHLVRKWAKSLFKPKEKTPK